MKPGTFDAFIPIFWAEVLTQLNACLAMIVINIPIVDSPPDCWLNSCSIAAMVHHSTCLLCPMNNSEMYWILGLLLGLFLSLTPTFKNPQNLSCLMNKCHNKVAFLLILGFFLVSLQKVANRDIKLENTLLDRDYKLLKLCDFGLSKVHCSAQAKRASGSRATAASEMWFTFTRRGNRALTFSVYLLWFQKTLGCCFGFLCEWFDPLRLSDRIPTSWVLCWLCSKADQDIFALTK